MSATAPTADLVTPLDVAAGGSASERGWRSASLKVGTVVLAVVLLASIAVRLLGIGAPNVPHLTATLQPPSLANPFGTDNLGRSVFLRTLYATVTDLTVGVITTYVPLVLGVLVGAVAGYLGGRLDHLLMRVTDFVLAFPFIVLVVAIIAILGPGLGGVYVGLILKGFPAYARLARGEMLVLREQQFILAARMLGFSSGRVIGRHALPHIVRPCLIFSLSDLVGNMLLLASLSFLGLGVQPPTPEWGGIIADGQSYLLTAWWISTLPGLFVVLVGVALSLIGEGAADRWLNRTTGSA